MGRPQRYPLVLTSALVAILILVALIVTGTVFYPNYLLPSTSLIRDLQELPPGSVKLKGVVTHVDESGKRVWLQDESGAVAINLDAAKVGIRLGQLVRIKARKTHAYDSRIGFTSVALQNVRVDVVSPRVPLPTAAPSTIETLAESEKNGIRVVMEGVLRRVSTASNGQTVLELGVEQEVSAILPLQAPELANWVNAKVRITGINDFVPGEGRGELSRRIRVQDREDIARVEDAPRETPLYSVRDLYRSRHDLKGRMVRMQGRVLALEPGNAVELEDPWGVVLCHFDELPSVTPGKVVEIAGCEDHFPKECKEMKKLLPSFSLSRDRNLVLTN